MKKFLSILLALTISLFSLGSLAACQSSSGNIVTRPTKLQEFAVKVSSNDGGTLISSAETVEEGSSVNFTLEADAGYVLKSFTVNGSEVELIPQEKTEEGKTPYNFTINNAFRDYDVNAVFAQSNVIIKFDEASAFQKIEDQSAIHGQRIGDLPAPLKVGKRFLGWEDGNGNVVNKASIADTFGEIVLYAQWQDITEDEIRGLAPFSATTMYYDMAATKYGVVWHTSVDTVVPVLQIVKGSAGDFTDAVTVNAATEEWIQSEFVTSCVVENLEYATEYSVRFGDLAADVWSKTYTFTTREEVVESVNFIYATDTQETVRIENQPADIKIGDTYFSQVMRDAAARFPGADFIAHGGDLVNYGAEAKYWREMLDSVEEYLFNMPIMLAAGNHEDSGYYSAGHITLSKLFNVDAPSGEHGAGDYYSFDYGPMHFVSIRSNDVFHYNNQIGAEQMAWLRSDLANAKSNPQIKWIVAMMHEGPIIPNFESAGSNYHQNTLGPQLIPVFDEYGVDLLLFGHNHYLASSYPIVWDATQAPTSKDGLTVRNVATLGEKAIHDGVEVDTFVYSGEERGTVYHETGCAGHQTEHDFPISSISASLAKAINFRSLASTGKGSYDAKDRSMYSIVEITNGELVLRTYAVDVRGLAKETDDTNVLNHGIYIDGFKLTK